MTASDSFSEAVGVLVHSVRRVAEAASKEQDPQKMLMMYEHLGFVATHTAQLVSMSEHPNLIVEDSCQEVSEIADHHSTADTHEIITQTPVDNRLKLIGIIPNLLAEMPEITVQAEAPAVSIAPTQIEAPTIDGFTVREQVMVAIARVKFYG